MPARSESDPTLLADFGGDLRRGRPAFFLVLVFKLMVAVWADDGVIFGVARGGLLLLRRPRIGVVVEYFLDFVEIEPGDRHIDRPGVEVNEEVLQLGEIPLT